MKKLSIALALLGLLLGTLLVGWFGFGRVLQGVLDVGWPGFGLIVGWQLLLFVLLGLAWDAIVPRRESGRLWVFVWGRMVRDAAANCLPFSQVGGFVFGARAVTLHGVAWPVATASTVVDVTAEFLAQLAFAAVGLSILVARQPHSALAIPLAIGLFVAIVAAGAFIALQRGAAPLFGKLGRRIAGSWFADAQERVDMLQAELSLIYRHTGRLAIGFAVHLIGWLGTGVAGWIAYRLLGARIDIDAAIAIEALLSALMAAGFLVPVSAGVQEAGYAGLGAVFGIPAELSLGVSLIRRARDIAVGVPILLVWQFIEMRRLRAAAVSRAAAANLRAPG